MLRSLGLSKNCCQTKDTAFGSCWSTLLSQRCPHLNISAIGFVLCTLLLKIAVNLLLTAPALRCLDMKTCWWIQWPFLGHVNQLSFPFFQNWFGFVHRFVEIAVHLLLTTAHQLCVVPMWKHAGGFNNLFGAMWINCHFHSFAMFRRIGKMQLGFASLSFIHNAGERVPFCTMFCLTSRLVCAKWLLLILQASTFELTNWFLPLLTFYLLGIIGKIRKCWDL